MKIKNSIIFYQYPTLSWWCLGWAPRRPSWLGPTGSGVSRISFQSASPLLEGSCAVLLAAPCISSLSSSSSSSFSIRLKIFTFLRRSCPKGSPTSRRFCRVASGRIHWCLSVVSTCASLRGWVFPWRWATSPHCAVSSPSRQAHRSSSLASSSPTRWTPPLLSSSQGLSPRSWYPSAFCIGQVLHDHQCWQFLTFLRLLFQFFLDVLVLLGLVVDDIAHERVEGLLGAVVLELLDGRVEDGILEFFGELVPEAGLVSWRQVLNGGDVGNVAALWLRYSEMLLKESYAFLLSIIYLHSSMTSHCRSISSRWSRWKSAYLS